MITSVSRTTAFVVASTESAGKVVFNNIIDNDLGCYSIGDTSYFQFPANGISILFSGTYLITANVTFASGTTGGIRYLSITAPASIDSPSDGSQKVTNITNIVRSQVSVGGGNAGSYTHSLSATVAWRLYYKTVVQMRVWSTGASGTVSTAVDNPATGAMNATLSAALILK